MASVFKYRCITCNTDLGAKGETVESHLASNPTHCVEEILYYSTQTLSDIEGATRIYNNELFQYDTTRSLWLSANRVDMLFGIPAATQNNVYQRLWGVMTPTVSTMGFYVPANATITSLTATRSAGTGTGIFDIRVYGGSALTSITLNANILSGTSTVNVNVAGGTILSSYLSGSTTSSYPQLVAEIAFRI